MGVAQRPADCDVHHAVRGEYRSVVAAVGGADLKRDATRPRDLDERVHVGRGVTDELSIARATAPPPIGAMAKLGSSSGESADTNVSIAYTRRGVVPSAAAATAAPSSPISSRTLQMKITWCLRAARSRRRSARSCAAQPTRSSNERPVALVPVSRTYCLDIVTVAPRLTCRAMAPARDLAPTSTRSGGGVWRVKPESRGMNTPATSPRSVCTSAG